MNKIVKADDVDFLGVEIGVTFLFETNISGLLSMFSKIFTKNRHLSKNFLK
jgi:hypothetical protein